MQEMKEGKLDMDHGWYQKSWDGDARRETWRSCVIATTKLLKR